VRGAHCSCVTRSDRLRTPICAGLRPSHREAAGWGLAAGGDPRGAEAGARRQQGDDEGDEAARATAESLAAALGASARDGAQGPIDLLVVGSRPESHPGRVTISASTDYAVEAAICPVLVVPRGVTIRFDAPASATPQQPEQPDSPPVTA